MKDRISIKSVLLSWLPHAVLQQEDGVTDFWEGICMSYCHQPPCVPPSKGGGLYKASPLYFFFTILYQTYLVAGRMYPAPTPIVQLESKQSVVQILDVAGVLLDEFLSGFYLLPHQQGKDLIGLDRILQTDLL